MIDFALAGKITVWAIIIGVPMWKLYQWASQPVASSALRVAGTVEQEAEETRAAVAHSAQWPTDETEEIPFMLDSIDDRDDFLKRHGIGKGHW
jgi:hypothetical protein